jgi:hypothetical protein
MPVDAELETPCEQVGLKASSSAKGNLLYAFQESREQANKN